MKIVSIFLVALFLTTAAWAQKIEVLNKMYGMSKTYPSKTKINLLISNVNIGDTLKYDTTKAPYGNGNKLLAVCDSNGKLIKKYVLNGINTIFSEHSDDAYLFNYGNYKSYIDNIQVLDSININAYRYVLMRLNLLTGNFSILRTFYVKFLALPVIATDPSTNSLYIMFSRISKFDSTLYDTSVFDKSKTSILKLDANYNITQKWKVDSIFTNFSVSNNRFYLSASTSKTNTTYKLNNTVYIRNGTTDRFLADNIYGVYDLNQKKYLGTTVIKSKGENTALAVYPNFLTYFQFSDSIVVNNKTIKVDSNYLTKRMLLSLNEDGTIKWYKFGNGSSSLTNLRIDNGKINFSLEVLSFFNFIWDGTQLQNCYYWNRIFLNADGSYIKHYPIKYNDKLILEPSYVPAKENISYISFGYDSVVINGTTYISSIRGDKIHNYLFMRYNSDTSQASGIFENHLNKKSILVYPNPASNKIKIQIPDQNFEENFKLRIFDLTGKSVFEQKDFSQENEIDISTFNNGLYFIELSSKNKRYSCKWIKE
ncbi:MAG: T9SS type A sorting domain-containing protein [Bacteroidota bacterium]|nr:T9SS type A sorting domain-containing protein [Bacteroidota bacterium]